MDILKLQSLRKLVQPARTQQLRRLRCDVFQTTYNPTGLRTGAKYLKKRLRGPSMVEYYPELFDLMKIRRQYPVLELMGQHESERFCDVEERKSRGKGTPKKNKKGASIIF
ncbi:hypothetical protein FISHEDRAFT_49151 [Fistulina hepatica ATCC 64428]|uniref:Small ribosomal subunit protein mS33 n=1 Tax=Fistulina hepatica ATCC 64428 TaxID=1128425 RepID=A0A0D7A6X9_9AGAR|nr:hypothetical protein FISHEDRAFT_49151 [Fistulina hepatica ATCC 64428]